MNGGRRLTTLQAAVWFGWNPRTRTGGYSPATLRSWRLRGGGPEYEQPCGERGKVFYRIAALERWWKRNGSGR